MLWLPECAPDGRSGCLFETINSICAHDQGALVMLKDAPDHIVECSQVLAHFFCEFVLAVLPEGRSSPLVRAVVLAHELNRRRNVWWEWEPEVAPHRVLHLRGWSHPGHDGRWRARYDAEPMLYDTWVRLRDKRIASSPYRESSEMRAMRELAEDAVCAVLFPDHIKDYAWRMLIPERELTCDIWEALAEDALLSHMARTDRHHVFRIYTYPQRPHDRKTAFYGVPRRGTANKRWMPR